MSGPDGIQARFKGRLGDFQLDVDFTVAPRGLTALTGPSGSGKSTVLRCIAGLTRLPGRLVVDGEVWQDGKTFLPPHQRPVGMVFQDAGLLAHLSVKGNLFYGARRSRDVAVIARPEVIELLGLKGLLGRSVAHLSGGERQRVALGRALLSQPRLLLMDEPLSSLDAASKAEILPYLERLHRSLSIPVLYVSHDASEVRRLADHRLAMDNGRIVPAPPEPADAETQLAAMDAEDVRRLALAAIREGLAP